MDDIKRGFKAKTIEKTIRQKIKYWLKSITDEELRKSVEANYIVTGGAIASMLQGDLPNDYDIYLQNSDVAAQLAQYYLNKVAEKTKNDMVSKLEVKKSDNRVEIFIKSAGMASEGQDEDAPYQYFEQDPSGAAADQFLEATDHIKEGGKGTYKVVMMTSNAISLSDDIQVILRFCGPPEEIHKNFDFVHATCWFTEDKGLNVSLEATMAIMSRELRYIGSLYPICSIFRLKKFIRRGWTITAGEMFKIAYDVSKLDLNDWQVLREQLTGVDVAYFAQVIRELQKNKDRDVDRTYLFELMDRAFDE
jgi:hypothetical protein